PQKALMMASILALIALSTGVEDGFSKKRSLRPSRNSFRSVRVVIMLLQRPILTWCVLTHWRRFCLWDSCNSWTGNEFLKYRIRCLSPNYVSTRVQFAIASGDSVVNGIPSLLNLRPTAVTGCVDQN